MNVEGVLALLVRPGREGVRQADGGCDNNLCRYAQSCDCQPCNCDGPHQARCIEDGGESEPTDPAEWSRWAAAQGWDAKDAQDVALEAFYAASGEE